MTDEEEKIQYIEGDEPIREKWVTDMKIKTFRAKFKDGIAHDVPLVK